MIPIQVNGNWTIAVKVIADFIGALLTKVMRPLFKIPGRAAVDCITSWIGDGTLGVMLTANQYEDGY